MTNIISSVQPSAARDARVLKDTDPVVVGAPFARAAKSPAALAPWVEAVHVNTAAPRTGIAARIDAGRPGTVPLRADVGRADAKAPMFLDRADTILPMEYRGTEVLMEAHAYEDDSASYQAMALVYRKLGLKEAPFVRIHSGCVTGDIFHSLRCDCYQQLQKALDTVVESHNGIVIYLPYHEGRGIGLVAKMKAYAQQDAGLDTVDANLAIGAPVDAREYDLAAKILKDLKATDIRLLTNNPLKVEAMRGYGINVVEQVPHITVPSIYNERYLKTKRERMAHKL
jgi:GTP cyclohydrolase II